MSEKNLKNHITKFHKIDINYTCDKCDFSANRITELDLHEKTVHVRISEKPNDDRMDMDCDESDKKLSDGNKRKTSANNSPVSSPPPKRVQLLSSIQV